MKMNPEITYQITVCARVAADVGIGSKSVDKKTFIHDEKYPNRASDEAIAYARSLARKHKARWKGFGTSAGNNQVAVGNDSSVWMEGRRLRDGKEDWISHARAKVGVKP